MFRQSSVACRSTAKAARKLIFDTENGEDNESSIQDSTLVQPLAWRNTNPDMDCFDVDLKQPTFNECTEENLSRHKPTWHDTPRRYILGAEVTESVSVTFTARRYARLELEADDYRQISCRESSGSTNIFASNISPTRDKELSQNCQSLTNVMDGLNIDNVYRVDSDVNVARCSDFEYQCDNDLIQDRVLASGLNVEQCDTFTSDLNSQTRCQTTTSKLNVEQINVLTSGLFKSYRSPAVTSGVMFEQFQSEASSVNIEEYHTNSSHLKATPCCSSRDVENRHGSNSAFTPHGAQSIPLDQNEHRPFSGDVNFTNYRTSNTDQRGEQNHCKPNTELTNSSFVDLNMIECQGTSYLKNQYFQPSSPDSNFQHCPDTNSNLPTKSSNPLRFDLGIKYCQTGDGVYGVNKMASVNSSDECSPAVSPAIQKSNSSNVFLSTSELNEQSAYISPQLHSRKSDSMKSINTIQDQPSKINFRTSSSLESCSSVEKSSRIDRTEACQVDKEELETIKYMLRNCELFHPLDMTPRLPRPTPAQSPVHSLMDAGDAVDVRGLATRLSHMKSEGRMRYALKQYVHSHIPSMHGKMDDIIESTIQQIANVNLGAEVSRPQTQTTLSAITTSEAWLKLGHSHEADNQPSVGMCSEFSSLNGMGVDDGIVELHERNLDHHLLGIESESQQCASGSRGTSEFTRIINRNTSEACNKQQGLVNSQDISTTESRLTSGTDRKRKRKITEVAGQSTRKGKKRVSFAFTEDECSEVVCCKKAYLD